MSDLNVLLLDRDGVLNRDVGYLFNPDKIELLPHVIEGLVRFRDAGWCFFIMTNQSGIARGLGTMEDFLACQKRLFQLLGEHGISIEATRMCSHHPDEQCLCRKPELGMWLSLREEFPDIQPEQCVLVGDKDADILFGKNIGCKTARIPSDQFPMEEETTYTVGDLNELADILLSS